MHYQSMYNYELPETLCVALSKYVYIWVTRNTLWCTIEVCIIMSYPKHSVMHYQSMYNYELPETLCDALSKYV